MFRRLVKFAVQQSPYFADVAAGRRLDIDRCRLADFPELTKTIFIRDFDRIATEPTITRSRVAEFVERSRDPIELLDGRFYVLRTSGTTGTPGYMAFTPREWIRGCSHENRLIPGLRWKRRVAFVAITDQHFAGVSLAMTGRRRTNRLFFDCRPFDLNLTVQEIDSQLNEFQPQILSGYASTLRMLALEQQHQRLRLRPRFVCSSGEVLRPAVRRQLEETFQARVIDLYASCETLFLGAADSSDGLMLFEDDLVFELFPTHVLVTNIFNRTIPLIRYRIDDVLVVNEERPASPFRWLQNISGRQERSFELRNNEDLLELVTPLSLAYLPTQTLLGLQIFVVEVDRLVIRVQLPSKMTTDARLQTLRDVENAIRNWLVEKRMDHSVKFTIEETEQLEIDPVSGKARLIVYNASHVNWRLPSFGR